MGANYPTAPLFPPGVQRSRPVKRLLLATFACALALAPPAGAAPPPIKHVFVVFLENKTFTETFGVNTKATYFARELTQQGQLVPNFFGVTHNSLGNYIAVLGGQSSNVETQSDCQVYSDGKGSTTPDASGQVVGQGCVYPTEVKTLSDQLEAKGLTWRGYMEDMGDSCKHPALNAHDETQSAKVGNQYAARHNPFVYFHSIVDQDARCKANVVDLRQMANDLASTSTTANFSFITPNLCNDGHDEPCVDGAPGGLVSADAWLRKWVPQILASPAMQDGLLVVTFDEAETTGMASDASACCGQQAGPNTPNSGGQTPGAGGGRVGAVVVSPYVVPGSMNATSYNHYALLRSVEDIFGLGYLGYAGQAGLRAFGDDVYGRASAPGPIPGVGQPVAPAPKLATPSCATRRLARARRGRLARGSLLASVRIQRRVDARPRLTVRVAGRAVALRIVGLPRRGSRGARVGASSGERCTAYGVGLRYARGRVVVEARVKAGRERRVIRY